MAELSSDIMRGFNDLIVLSVLMEGDSYGYDISRCISERSGGRYPIKETTLYSTITRLEKNMYIRSYVGTESFGRQRTYYTLTPTGQTYFEQKCAEWGMAKHVIGEFVDKFIN